MTTNIDLILSRLTQVANPKYACPFGYEMFPNDCRKLLEYLSGQDAQLAALSRDSYNKDAVIAEYQCQSMKDGLEIERLKKELAEAVESIKEACAAEFDRRDNGIVFYDPHEPAEIIRGLFSS